MEELMMNRWLALAMFLGGSVMAQASALSGVSNLTSGYLVEDQINYRISFPETGKVGVQKDANTCSVDTYGRANGCTRMLYPVDVFEAKELSSQDGLTLYELTPELRLVLQKVAVGGSSAYLLKVDSKGEVLKRIPLFSEFY
jgi:hypothetical protein